MAGAFLAGAFLATAFLATALAGAFFATAFAGAFFATDFAAGFLAATLSATGFTTTSFNETFVEAFVTPPEGAFVATNERPAETLVIGALRMAIRSRQPGLELIHHTDRGGQYASHEYRRILSRARMPQSMSRADDCYDNAFMESCFGRLKAELEMTSYATIDHAAREIPEYINYYNFKRRHSSLDYVSPNSFESSPLP